MRARIIGGYTTPTFPTHVDVENVGHGLINDREFNQLDGNDENIKEQFDAIKNSTIVFKATAMAGANVNITNPGTNIFGGVTLESRQILFVLGAISGGFQTDAKEAGLYIFDAADQPLIPVITEWSQIVGSQILIINGIFAGKAYINSNQDGGTIGSTQITYRQSVNRVNQQPIVMAAVNANTQLSLSSAPKIIVTGSSGFGGAFTMPDATTLEIGFTQEITNQVTNSQITTLAFGGASLGLIPVGRTRILTLQNKSTSAGVWAIESRLNQYLNFNGAGLNIINGTAVGQVPFYQGGENWAVTLPVSSATPNSIPMRDASSNFAVAVLAANGIQFPATQVPSADPNTLDDYKEITFPITDASLSALTLTSVCRGTKIGNRFYFQAYVAYPNTSGDTNPVVLTGLPYISANIANAYSSFTVTSGAGISLTALLNANSIQISPRTSANTTPMNQVFSNGFLIISGSYQV